MTLEEVIEHLNDCMSEADKILWPECLEAHNIGIEALKGIKAVRQLHPELSPFPLPGETEE